MIQYWKTIDVVRRDVVFDLAVAAVTVGCFRYIDNKNVSSVTMDTRRRLVMQIYCSSIYSNWLFENKKAALEGTVQFFR